MSFFKNSNPIPKRENRIVTGASCSVVTITVFTTPIRLGEEGGGGGGGVQKCPRHFQTIPENLTVKSTFRTITFLEIC